MQRVWSCLLPIKLEMVWLMVIWVPLIAIVLVHLLPRTKMVVRVALTATLFTADSVANATIATNLVTWHATAPVPVVRVTLVATLFATDTVVNVTTATNLVIWHAIALATVLGLASATAMARVTLVATLFATDTVANVTTATNLVIWHAIASATVLGLASATAITAVSLVTWRVIAVILSVSPAVAMIGTLWSTGGGTRRLPNRGRVRM